MKSSRRFWIVAAISVLAALYFINIWFLLPILFYFMITVNKVRDSFWKQFAETNSWTYIGNTDASGESGVMFKQGSGVGVLEHLIAGSVDGRAMRLFQYQFSVKRGKDRESFFYTVFSFKFKGSFPDVYLNNKHNAYSISVGEEIPLPVEFEKQFSLSAPKEYEVEALEIFTPEVLAKLLDGGFTHDVEFIGQEMHLFVDGYIDSLAKLKEEFGRAVALEKLLEVKLDRFKFDQVGNMPTTL